MDLRIEGGNLLASSPDMLDPNFMHRVVLICRHGDEGAYGLVVNRPCGITVDELLPQHPVLGHSTFPIFAGGPIGRDTMQFVHDVPQAIPGGLELTDGLYMGGDLDALAAYITADEEEAGGHARLFIGYSGWGRGQLDAELATGSWLPAPLIENVVFAVDGEAVWRRVVRSLGDETRGLEDLPPDVSWN